MLVVSNKRVFLWALIATFSACHKACQGFKELLQFWMLPSSRPELTAATKTFEGGWLLVHSALLVSYAKKSGDYPMATRRGCQLVLKELSSRNLRPLLHLALEAVIGNAVKLRKIS